MNRSFSKIERRTIQLLVRDGYGASSYLAINAYNDFFYRNKVEFIAGEKPVLVFYFPNGVESSKDYILQLRNEIIEISMLIDYLKEKQYISFLSTDSTNTLDSVGGFIKTDMHNVSLSLDKRYADIMFECMNKEAIISKTLKDLADELSISEPIPERHYNDELYFEKQRKQSGRSDTRSSVNLPKQLPGFVLCHNYDWDDNSFHNWYCLHYFDAHENWTKVGEFRLMHKDGESWNYLDDSFNHLSNDFCSLGIDLEFYKSMYSVLGNKMMEDILHALSDCSFNRSLYEMYKSDEQFKQSLYRDSINGEQCLRLSKFIMNGRTFNKAFSFKYLYHPPYNTQSKTEWVVDFMPNVPSFMRCVGVIGENGVGKTRMLKQFIKDVLSKNPDGFPDSLPPVFSSIVSICSTPFDSLMRLDCGDVSLKYTKCCLEQNLSETEDVVIDGFNEISKRGRLNGESLIKLYIDSLKEELPTENVDEVFIYHDSGVAIARRYELNKEKLHELIHKLSSGQLHSMVLLSHIFQNIDFDSLLVIDEPEVHLHPNAISNFYLRLNKILDLFSSYSITVTHSPLVVREMIGNNVFVLRRLADNNAYIGHCNQETFGEDISILYKDIFGYDETTSCFNTYILSELNNHPEYTDLLENLPVKKLSLNSRFSIRNIIAGKKR